MFKKLFIVLFLVVTLGFTGCVTSGQPGTTPQVDYRQIVPFMDAALVLYGDEMDPEIKAVFEDMIAQLKKAIQTGEEVSFEQVIIRVLTPALVEQLGEQELSKEQAAFAIIGLETVRMYIIEGQSEAFDTVYPILRAIFEDFATREEAVA